MTIVTDVQEALNVLTELKRDYDNIKRVLDCLESEGIAAEITIHQEAVSAESAAEYMQQHPREIIKTLLFIANGEPLLVLVQGTHRVAVDKLKRIVEADELRLARPEEVKEYTGYRVGSVSPFDLELPTVVDAPILEEEVVRPAAGSTCVGAVLKPETLLEQLPAEVKQVS